jgi:3-hydroxyacyl-[acyl-carrier-protein] dehydratase
VNQTLLDCRDILALLPHRYPFMLVDRVIGYDPEKSLTAIKNVTYNEPFFPGHFPEVPIMPGVMILEAMAQTCGLLAIKISGVRRESGMLLYFAGIDNARFKRPVVPGDRLEFVATVVRHKRDIWKFSCRATVDGELACEADMLCALRNDGVKADDAQA